MNTTTIKRDTLLAIVTQNRKTHVSEYETALVVYKKERIENLEKILADIKSEKDVNVKDISKPVSFEADYNRVIRMLELSCSDVIELTTPEFEQYVMDNWHWKNAFDMTTKAYNARH